MITLLILSLVRTMYKQTFYPENPSILSLPAEQVTVNIMFIEEDQNVNASMVAMEAQKDPVLSKVTHFTQHGWPKKPNPAF